MMHTLHSSCVSECWYVCCRQVCAQITTFDCCLTDLVFTVRCYASAVLAMALCLSVHPSVTSRSSTKTAERRIT